jgi:hypothetical protein
MSKKKNKVLTNMGKIVYLKSDSCLGNPNPKYNRKALITNDNGIHIGINGFYSFKHKNKNEGLYLKRIEGLSIFEKETGVSWVTFYKDVTTGKMFRIDGDLITYTGYQIDIKKMIEINNFIQKQVRFNKKIRNRSKKKRTK